MGLTDSGDVLAERREMAGDKTLKKYVDAVWMLAGAIRERESVRRIPDGKWTIDTIVPSYNICEWTKAEWMREVRNNKNILACYGLLIILNVVYISVVYCMKIALIVYTQERVCAFRAEF